MINKRGWIECPICGKRISVTFKDQKVWRHGPIDHPCETSGKRADDYYRAAPGATPRRLKR